MVDFWVTSKGFIKRGSLKDDKNRKKISIIISVIHSTNLYHH